MRLQHIPRSQAQTLAGTTTFEDPQPPTAVHKYISSHRQTTRQWQERLRRWAVWVCCCVGDISWPAQFIPSRQFSRRELIDWVKMTDGRDAHLRFNRRPDCLLEEKQVATRQKEPL